MFRRRRYRPSGPRLLPPLWRRRPLSLAILTALLILAALDRTGRLRPSGDDYTRYHGQAFRVTHVADGDTLDVDAIDGGRRATRIRLLGVDTPELAAASEGPMHFGPEASAFTKGAVDGRRVRLELPPTRPRDKYRRLLAYVYLADTGEMLNEVLLSTGHAYADTRFDHPRFERFVDLENKARRSAAGLWKDVQPAQMPSWRQAREAR